MALVREEVEAALDQVRPYLHSDGGDVQLIDVVGNRIRINLVGACGSCPSASMTLRYGIETALKEALPEFEGFTDEAPTGQFAMPDLEGW